jgi:hypothetical protein
MTFQPGLRADSAAHCYRRHPVVKAMVVESFAEAFCHRLNVVDVSGESIAGRIYLRRSLWQMRIAPHLSASGNNWTRWSRISGPRTQQLLRPFNAASNVCQVHHFVPGQGSPAVYLPPIALDRVPVLRKDRLRPGQIKAKSLATDRWRLLLCHSSTDTTKTIWPVSISGTVPRVEQRLQPALLQRFPNSLQGFDRRPAERQGS